MEVRMTDYFWFFCHLLFYLLKTNPIFVSYIIVTIRYDSFVNYDFWPSIHVPVLVYFKEDQTPKVRNLFLYWLYVSTYVFMYSNFVIPMFDLLTNRKNGALDQVDLIHVQVLEWYTFSLDLLIHISWKKNSRHVVVPKKSKPKLDKKNS